MRRLRVVHFVCNSACMAYISTIKLSQIVRSFHSTRPSASPASAAAAAAELHLPRRQAPACRLHCGAAIKGNHPVSISTYLPIPTVPTAAAAPQWPRGETGHLVTAVRCADVGWLNDRQLRVWFSWWGGGSDPGVALSPVADPSQTGPCTKTSKLMLSLYSGPWHACRSVL